MAPIVEEEDLEKTSEEKADSEDAASKECVVVAVEICE